MSTIPEGKDGIEIRRLDEADADWLVKTQKEIIEHPYYDKVLRYWLTLPNWHIWLVECDNKPTGLAVFRLNYGTGELYELAITEKYCNKGIGAQLLDAIENYADRQGVRWMIAMTVETQRKGIRFLKRRGYLPAAICHHYYSDTGEHAALLWKTLKDNNIVTDKENA